MVVNVLQVFTRVRRGRFPKEFEERSSKVHKLVRLLTSESPKHRPTAAEIKDHYLNDLKLNKSARKAYVPVL